MTELIKFMWLRLVLKARNIGYARCRWGGPRCEDHRRWIYCRWFGLDRVCILRDEGMYRTCYFDDYVLRYK